MFVAGELFLIRVPETRGGSITIRGSNSFSFMSMLLLKCKVSSGQRKSVEGGHMAG